MKKYIFILAGIILIGIGNLNSQNSNIMYFMRNVPGSYSMNPANTPISKFYFNFPAISGFNIDFSTSGFAYKDIINQHPIYQDSLQIDLKGFYSKLNDDNHLKLSTSMPLFGFGFKAGKNYISLGLDLNFDARLNFSKDLIGVLVYGSKLNNGIANIMDDKLISLNAYISPSIGFARKINDKLDVGLRAKVPFGILNVNTEKSTLRLDLNDGVSVMGDFLIHTSNVAGKFSFSGINSPTSPEFIDNIVVSEMLKNRGLAFDIGASYKIRKDMMVSLAVQDLGYIRWKTNTTDIVSKNPGASFEINPYQYNSSSDTQDDMYENIEDSIMSALDLESRPGSSYTTYLPTKIYASYTWNFAKTQYLSALYMGAIGSNYFDNNLSVFYNCQLERYLNLSFGNTFVFSNSSNTSLINPSAAINFNLYLINFFVGGGVRSSFDVAELTGFNIFFGMNFSIGYTNYWKKDRSEDAEPQIDEVEEKTDESQG